ncbi:hypothetical protein I79_004079 [Cricetulus griseus]|uniref:Uncharacterized protein n=1 Tax=Cricetulus griseus TaxID=10029 RepID=G3H1P7_CRIGR|nr:hypothetical protein I79_004079 [Cricetulus griseus]
MFPQNDLLCCIINLEVNAVSTEYLCLLALQSHAVLVCKSALQLGRLSSSCQSPLVDPGAADVQQIW